MAYADNYCVYAIENTNTNKKYIGSTLEYEKRLDRHFYDLKSQRHHSIYLQRSFNKHGEDAFVHYVVKGNLSEKEAHKLEEKMISQDYDNLYNVSKKASGGDLISYHPNLEEIREVHSQNAKDRWENPVEGDGWTEIKYGKKNGMYGRTHTDEVKQRLSEINTGKKHTEESKRKMSKTHIERYKDPKEREKVSRGLHKRYSDPEERRKTGEASRKAWERRGYKKVVKMPKIRSYEKNKVEFMYKGVCYKGWENAEKEIGLSKPTIMKRLLDPSIEDSYYISEYMPWSEDRKLKKSESQRGRVHSEETKRKIKESNLRVKASEYTMIFPNGVAIHYNNRGKFEKHVNLVYGLSSGMIQELIKNNGVYEPKRYYLQPLKGIRIIKGGD